MVNHIFSEMQTVLGLEKQKRGDIKGTLTPLWNGITRQKVWQTKVGKIDLWRWWKITVGGVEKVGNTRWFFK